MSTDVTVEELCLEGTTYRTLADMCQETLNFWKQLSHVLKYFRTEEDPQARLPANFIEGFLQVRLHPK